MFRGQNLGVLGVFSREPRSAQQFRWLRVFADQAAVSIANARAFEELDALRARLELENEYLRRENRYTSISEILPVPAWLACRRDFLYL